MISWKTTIPYFRYKISCSQGGGYCDCGDPEAWTAHVHCTIHEQGSCAIWRNFFFQFQIYMYLYIYIYNFLITIFRYNYITNGYWRSGQSTSGTNPNPCQTRIHCRSQLYFRDADHWQHVNRSSRFNLQSTFWRHGTRFRFR